jgi:hypothetical protein
MHRKLLCFIQECPAVHVMLNAETIYKRRTMIYTLLSYASRNFPGSIPGTTRKKTLWVWNGVHSASWVQLRSYLIEK